LRSEQRLGADCCEVEDGIQEGFGQDEDWELRCAVAKSGGNVIARAGHASQFCHVAGYERSDG
jgi:hypothetical protein